jgi:hypothetical protein
MNNFKCYVDWKWCGKKLSWQIWSTMWIRSDDGGWCYDLNWGAFGLEQILKLGCHDLICIAMWIGI